jgi:uncharacterized membrane protein YjfL (UPF0719 family)
MTIYQIFSTVVYLIAIIIIFLIGKLIYDRLHPRFKLKEQLIEKDNFAVALAVTGYYLGLIFVIGGSIVGPSAGLIEDLIDIFFFGLVAIILLNIANTINDKLILYKFDNVKEIIDDQNAGTGVIVAAIYIANGLILYGAFSGEGGDLVTAVVFWLFSQAALVVIIFIYNLITPFDIHEHIEKDNVAVGVAVAGLIIGLGMIISTAVSGDFISWTYNFYQFGSYLLVSIILLPILRLIGDKILLPGRKLTDELVNQEKPNVGAGLIEGFVYVAAAFIIGWAL